MDTSKFKNRPLGAPTVPAAAIEGVESQAFSRKHRDEVMELRRSFATSFDESAITTFVRQVYRLDRFNRGPNGTAPAGEGAHFVVYQFGRPGQQLAVKIAKESFLKLGDPWVRQWRSTLTALTQADLPLIPPFSVLSEIQEAVILVQPWIGEPKTAVAPHWQPIEHWLEALRVGLADVAIELGDWPQIRCRRGVPWLVDLSDIQPTVRSK